MKRKMLFFCIFLSSYLSAHTKSNQESKENEQPFQEIQQFALMDPIIRPEIPTDYDEEIDYATPCLTHVTICLLGCSRCANEVTKKYSAAA